MWPVVIGAGAVTFLIKTLLDETEDSERDIKKRVFIIFAFEDEKYRDYLVAQAKNERSTFTFVDMSVKQPWNEKVWKQKSRTKNLVMV
jgi:hypothetical protein